MKPIKGIFPPLTSPYVKDKIAINKFHKNLELIKKHSVHGCVVMGSTGEAPLLHEIEKVQIIKAARIVTPDDQILIAGVGRETVNETARLAKIASEYGVDALLVITPHYYQNQMNDEALISWFMDVADRIKSPMLIYNIPQITGVNISPETVLRLSEHPKIVGIKDSSGSLEYVYRILDLLPEHFNVLVGSASILAPALLAGATGGILAIANVLPELTSAIYQACEKGEQKIAHSLQVILAAATKAILGKHGIAGLKAAMDIRGLNGGAPRLPLLPCSEDVIKEIDSYIDKLIERKVLKDKKLV